MTDRNARSQWKKRGNWDGRGLGAMQRTQDLQREKESCHSWKSHVNKVLAHSRYLPSSSNKYPRAVDACRSLSNCHKYINWNYDIWSLAAHVAVFHPLICKKTPSALYHNVPFIPEHFLPVVCHKSPKTWKVTQKFKVLELFLSPSLAQSSIVLSLKEDLGIFYSHLQ